MILKAAADYAKSALEPTNFATEQGVAYDLVTQAFMAGYAMAKQRDALMAAHHRVGGGPDDGIIHVAHNACCVDIMTKIREDDGRDLS